MHETSDFISYAMTSFEHDRGQVILNIQSRIWHDDACGMSAEPVSYQYGAGQWTPVETDSSDAMQQFVAGVVASEYTDELLQCFLLDDPAFERVGGETNPVSEQQYQNMRV